MSLVPEAPNPIVFHETTDRLGFRDVLGRWRMRWGIGRNGFRVEPGLYRLGEAGPEAPVFVSANYKMSFDLLRSSLATIPKRELGAWILVLDTKGVNVWCAAGKGSFGTTELCGRIFSTGLAGIVSHRRLILPQLGASGVSAALVKKFTGFSVVWGPVEARDIPAFMANGMKATPDMRIKRFPIGDRLALVPLEIVQSWKIALPCVALAALLALIAGLPFDPASWLLRLVPYLLAIASGAALTPIFLPWIPPRPFAAKGAVVGILAAAAYALIARRPVLDASGLVLLSGAVASFLAMNFTGASTYTNASGVKKEMRYAVPAQIAAAVAGFGLQVIAAIIGNA